MIRPIKMIVLTTVWLAVAAVSVHAQEIVGKGLKFSVNRAGMQGAGADPSLTQQAGFAAGGFVTLGLTDRFSIQPELLYVQKGAQLESGANPYEYRFSYVEIPVLWKVAMAAPAAGFRPNVYAGPFMGVKTSASLETYLSRRQEESAETNLPSARGIDAGYAVGVGADLRVGPGRIVLDARYGKSLTNAFAAGASYRHSIFSVFVGYSFD